MTVPDEELFAFVDGELPPEAMARIEAALETDPQLALRVETQRALRRLLSGAHAGAMEPQPPRRAAPITGAEPPKPVARPAEVIAFPGAKAKEKVKARDIKVAKPAKAAGRRFQPWMAMVACLVAGLFIGRVAIPTLPSLSGADPVAPMAVGPLAQALSKQDSGVDSGPIRIGLSFKDQAGLYCRTFQAAGPAPLSGVACREKAAWRLRLVSAAAPVAKTADRPARSESPAAVGAAVDAMIAGPPLDAAGEAKAKAAGWKTR